MRTVCDSSPSAARRSPASLNQTGPISCWHETGRMNFESSAEPQANGFRTALDTIVSPNEAFSSLRSAPTWGWALLIAIVLYAIGGYLLTPAIVHATQADWPRLVAQNPRLSSLTAAQQQQQLALVLKIVQFGWISSVVILPIIIFIQSLIMLVFKAIGRGDGSFASLWAAAANIAVPAFGLAGIVLALIVRLRGSDTFNSPVDVQSAMPSLALLAPNASLKLHAFLVAINPFTVWAFVLVALAMTLVARVPRALAWTTGAVILLIGAGLAALGAR